MSSAILRLKIDIRKLLMLITNVPGKRGIIEKYCREEIPETTYSTEDAIDSM